MRNELTKSTLNFLSDRFYDFNDAMIHHISIDLMVQPDRAKVVIKAIDAKNGPITANNLHRPDTSFVTFEIENLTSYIIGQKANFSIVLVRRLSIGFVDDEIHINFNASSENDFVMQDHLGYRQFFVAGKRCYWTVEEDPK